jgi:hypothetical protein
MKSRIADPDQIKAKYRIGAKIAVQKLGWGVSNRYQSVRVPEGNG